MAGTTGLEPATSAVTENPEGRDLAADTIGYLLG